MGCFTHLYKSKFWLKNESFNTFSQNGFQNVRRCWAGQML